MKTLLSLPTPLPRLANAESSKAGDWGWNGWDQT